jgi:hypothetical protein
VGVQEVRWEGSGTEPMTEYIFFYRKGNENHELGTGFFVHKRIVSAVKRIEFVSDKINELATRSGNKSIRDPYRRINEFKRAYQLRNNLVKDNNSDLLADSPQYFK